jgi:hypothetical protein
MRQAVGVAKDKLTRLPAPMGQYEAQPSGIFGDTEHGLADDL